MLTKEQKEIILIRKKFWYNRVFVCLEFIKNSLQHRELAFLPAKEVEEKTLKMRALFCETYSIWRKIVEETKFLETFANVYNSVAIFKDGAIPFASLNPYRRLEENEYKKFNETYANQIKFYDFLIDIDGKNFADAYYQARFVKELFLKYKLPFYINNSSSKGFHITIDGKYLSDYPILDLPNILNTVAYNIKNSYELEGLDNNIFDFRRIRKMPYSLNCGDTTVVLPLSDEEFDEKIRIYQEKYFQSNRVLNTIKIKNRGLLTRFQDIGMEQLRYNCRKLIKDFGDGIEKNKNK